MKGIGGACAIFYNIESEKYTDDEKLEAVLEVLDMPTHNGITKESMLRVIKWLASFRKPFAPEYFGDGYADGKMVYDTWVCPNCGEHYEIDYDDYEYCPKCGQHIYRTE